MVVRTIAWRSLVLGLIVGVIGVAAVGAILVGPLIISHRQDLPLEKLYGGFAVSAAARLNAGSAKSPVGNSPRAIQAGRDAYTGSCSVCHGADGQGKGIFGPATYPPATDLTTGDAKERSDSELFWILKNGLSFTGMPGFADQYDDQTIWSMVSYLRALQQGQAQAVAVPTATAQQLTVADFQSADPIQRGAAVYFAQGCQTCHGAVGDAPGNLGLRGGGGAEASRAVRRGQRGMPAYKQSQLSDVELADLQAYLASLPSHGSGEGGSD